jgi:hypothetical protein
MNEHAKQIWNAWLKGEEVEFKHLLGSNQTVYWQEAEPNRYGIDDQPQFSPSLWRIKPKSMTVGEMIDELSKYDRDEEVHITDGFAARSYAGHFVIVQIREDGEHFVDIGIGGTEEE